MSACLSVCLSGPSVAAALVGYLGHSGKGSSVFYILILLVLMRIISDVLSCSNQASGERLCVAGEPQLTIRLVLIPKRWRSGALVASTCFCRFTLRPPRNTPRYPVSSSLRVSSVYFGVDMYITRDTVLYSPEGLFSRRLGSQHRNVRRIHGNIGQTRGPVKQSALCRSFKQYVASV